MPGTIGHEFLFTTPFVTDDWLEAVSLFSPNQFSIGRRKSYCTVKAYCETWDKLKNCVYYLMGGQTVDQTLNLRRDLPARHPIWPEMRAKEILSIQGVQANGKQAPVTLAKLSAGAYKKFVVECAFDQRPYPISDDDPAVSESTRWLIKKSKPYVENIVMEGGQLVFVAPGKPWDNQPIMSSRPIVRQRKAAYSVEWYEVPLAFIADSTGTYPKFEQAIGSVNSQPFFGKAAGTMLLDDVDDEVYTDAITTDLFGGDPQRLVDVKFTFKWFDPPRGYAGETNRGWNLAPAYDGQYYFAKNSDTGQPQFPSFDMLSLFTYWGS